LEGHWPIAIEVVKRTKRKRRSEVGYEGSYIEKLRGHTLLPLNAISSLS
jgi:hypothetical protein